jgi:hypothetical protein
MHGMHEVTGSIPVGSTSFEAFPRYLMPSARCHARPVPGG